MSAEAVLTQHLRGSAAFEFFSYIKVSISITVPVFVGFYPISLPLRHLRAALSTGPRRCFVRMGAMSSCAVARIFGGSRGGGCHG